MKKLLFVSILILTGAVTARASTSELYLGPTFGATSLSNADGSLNRDMQMSYGADGFYIFDHFAAGLSFKNFGSFSDGNPAVNINQVNNWFSVEAKYLFQIQDFNPYVSVGAGPLVQTLTTTVVGVSDNSSGVYFARDIGLGVMGRFSRDTALGFNVGARYFQYSNTNGFDYILSIGFFPDFGK